MEAQEVLPFVTDEPCVPGEVRRAATELYVDVRVVARPRARKINLDRLEPTTATRGDFEYAYELGRGISHSSYKRT